jgi:hypothetical protein
MASSDGSGFGVFILGCAAGAAALYWGPSLYRQYVQKKPDIVRVEMTSDHTPGLWNRSARIGIEFSRVKANGQDWDWPMTAPELQVCIKEGAEYRRCLAPKDPVLAPCQGKFICETGPIKVPDVPFEIEIYEYDDYNAPDFVGRVDCDIGQTCKFDLGVVTVMGVGR